MSLLLYSRLFIKNNFTQVYPKIRKIALPLVETHLRVKRRKQFIVPTEVTIKFAGQKFLITLDPTNGFVDEQIFVSGVYEPDILLVLKKHLPLNGTFVDIGANIGQHSLFCASLLSESQGQVISFEPIPRLATQIKASAKLNEYDNMTIYELACSDSTYTTKIKLTPGNIGASSLHHTTNEYESVEITAVPGDEYLMPLEAINLIKIDTEGHEINVLKGLKKTLAKFKPTLVIEYSPKLSGDSPLSYAEEFFSILSPLGYRFYDLEMGEKEIIDTKTWQKQFNKLQTNLLCIAN